MLLKLSRLYFPPSVDHFLVLLYLVINSSVCWGFCENFVDVVHRFLEELHEGWLGITNIVETILSVGCTIFTHHSYH